MPSHLQWPLLSVTAVFIAGCVGSSGGEGRRTPPDANVVMVQPNPGEDTGITRIDPATDADVDRDAGPRDAEPHDAEPARDASAPDGPRPNQPPVFERLTVTRGDFANGCQTLMTGEAYDPEGGPLRWAWAVNGSDFQDLGEEGAAVAFMGGAGGVFQVAVRITDGAGAATEHAERVELADCESGRLGVASPDGSRAYMLTDPPSTPGIARVNAALMGGRLAEIESPEEQAFIAERFADRGPLWLGARRTDQPGEYAWSSGASVGFEAWCDGEPDNRFEPSWVLLSVDAGVCWDDADAQRRFPGLVEFELGGGDDDLSFGDLRQRPALPASGRDRLQLRLWTRSRVRLQIRDPQGTCVDVGAPVLSLGMSGDLIHQVEGTADAPCPSLDTRLEPGLYDVAVRGRNGWAIPGFAIRATTTPVTGYPPGVAHRLTTPGPGAESCLTLGPDDTYPAVGPCGTPASRVLVDPTDDPNVVTLSTEAGGEGLCFESRGPLDLTLEPCQPVPEQRFQLIPIGVGFVQVVPESQPGWCLNFDIRAGGIITVQACDFSLGQLWRITPD